MSTSDTNGPIDSSASSRRVRPAASRAIELVVRRSMRLPSANSWVTSVIISALNGMPVTGSPMSIDCTASTPIPPGGGPKLLPGPRPGPRPPPGRGFCAEAARALTTMMHTVARSRCLIDYLFDLFDGGQTYASREPVFSHDQFDIHEAVLSWSVNGQAVDFQGVARDPHPYHSQRTRSRIEPLPPGLPH